jgi:hypothetical protein
MDARHATFENLITALRHTDVTKARAILQFKPRNFDINGWSGWIQPTQAIHEAFAHCPEAVGDLLSDAEFKVDLQTIIQLVCHGDASPLRVSVAFGRHVYLLDQTDALGRNCLYYAIQGKKAALVLELLRLGVDVDLQYRDAHEKTTHALDLAFHYFSPQFTAGSRLTEDVSSSFKNFYMECKNRKFSEQVESLLKINKSKETKTVNNVVVIKQLIDAMPKVTRHLWWWTAAELAKNYHDPDTKRYFEIAALAFKAHHRFCEKNITFSHAVQPDQSHLLLNANNLALLQKYMNELRDQGAYEKLSEKIRKGEDSCVEKSAVEAIKPSQPIAQAAPSNNEASGAVDNEEKAAAGDAQQNEKLDDVPVEEFRSADCDFLLFTPARLATNNTNPPAPSSSGTVLGALSRLVRGR